MINVYPAELSSHVSQTFYGDLGRLHQSVPLQIKYISVVGHIRVYEIQSTLCVPHRPISSSHASGQNHNLTSHIFLNLPSSAFILSSNEKVPTFLQKVSPPPPVYFISCAPRKSHFWENHISSFCQKFLKSKTFLVRDTRS